MVSKLVKVPKKLRRKDLELRLPSGPRFQDRTGIIFNGQEVLGLAGFVGVYAMWLIRCQTCHKKQLIRSNYFCRKEGCINCRKERAKVHRTGLYQRYAKIRAGGLLCKSWLDYDQFVQDVGEIKPPHVCLKRKNLTKPFGPDNFYWCKVGWEKILLEKDGELLSMAELARRLNISRQALDQRIKSYPEASLESLLFKRGEYFREQKHVGTKS